MAEPNIAHWEQRKIEVRVHVPIAQSFSCLIGREQATEIARRAIVERACHRDFRLERKRGRRRRSGWSMERSAGYPPQTSTGAGVRPVADQ